MTLHRSRRALRNCGGFFDVATLKTRLTELESVMAAPDFWNNREKAQKTIAQTNDIRGKTEPLLALEKRMADLKVLEELTQEDGSEAALAELRAEFSLTEKDLDALELKVLLGGEHDKSNAIISLHAGAGGTEACDWANMLLRMYQRFCERHHFDVELLDILPGEEAGIKTATLFIRGDYAYGNLKAERGVHRLVRISPFNAQGKRQTSFASLDVIAEVEDDVEMVIEEKDIRVDVFRAGGHGGQGVNTTDSAVRITHLPTGLVVTCQNERSQLKNRASAMSVLRSRLYEIETDKKRAALEQYYGEKGEIGWGRQIRSYVFQPYQMVKDLRTGEQTSDVQGVMDGDLDAFIESFLRGKKRIDKDDDLD